MGQYSGSNPFLGISKASLQQALLTKLALLADLRVESKRHRERLMDIRSELHQTEHELEQIQYSLATDKVAQFPKPAPTPEPEVKRVIGRWGAVTYEPVVQSEIEPCAIRPKRARNG
jgi:hypothetical protein